MTDTELKEFILQILNERDIKYEQRMLSIENQINEVKLQIKESQNYINSANALALASMEKAINKAEIAVEKRFESVNEFRQQMGDMQTTLARKSEVDIKFDSLEKKLDLAMTQLHLNKGKETGIDNTWVMLSGIIAFLISSASFIVALIALFRK